MILRREPATATTDREEWFESTVRGVRVTTDARETALGGAIFGWNESVDCLPGDIYKALRVEMLELHWQKCGQAFGGKNG